MSHRLSMLLVFAAGIAVGAVTLWSLLPSPMTVRVVSENAELALERPVEEIRLDAVPLRQAVDQIASKAGIVIEADWTALARDRIGIDRPVTLHRRGERLANLLREALDQTHSDGAVWIEPHGDRVRLWSSTEPNQPKSVRVYDVRGLIGRKVPQSIQPSNAWSTADDEKSLCEILENNISNGRYTGLGYEGLQASRLTEGRLIVTDRWEVHRQIRRLLSELHHASNPPPSLPSKNHVYTWNAAAGRWLTAEPELLDAMLDRPMGQLRLQAVSFEQTIDAFAKASGIPVSIDSASLINVIDPEVRMPIVYPAGPAGQTLEKILTHNWGENVHQAQYFAYDGGLRIAANYDNEPISYFRFYDLRGWPPYRNEIKRTTGPASDDVSASPTTDTLVKFMLDNVAWNTWAGNGGRYPFIKVSGYHGMLIVRQTPRGHRQVREFLAAVRSLDPDASKPKQ